MASDSARPPAVADARDRVLEPIDAPRAEHDRHAVTRQLLRDGQTDAGRGAGDRRDRPFQVHGGMIL